MKTTTLAIALTLLTAGCMTQQELLSNGTQSEHRLKARPPVAAACLARNFDNFRSGWTSTVRALDATSTEMVGNWGPDITAVIAHVKPDRDGSIATIWLRPYAFVGRDDLVPAMLKGC